MSPEDIQRDRQALQIVGRAIEMTTVEVRRGYLEGACSGDERSKARVEALLEHHVQDDFLERPAVLPSAEATVMLPIAEKPGDRIGRYKLLQQIGEGGCGVVYMAEQEEPVQRRVALKVIKLGMDTKSVIARFEAERQALALMNHPSIAKVLDAGSTESGRPFFVMELVRGIKITDYCDQNNLSTRERLDLFIQVCHAIQHAHQKGIIHRDIKPANILVSLHDGVPVPVVIDFGIAKATERRLTDKTLFTAFEQFIGTPAYTSPEQAEMSRLDIDTRSDIYSLGVLLYELLTSKTPFDSKELLAAGLDEMRRTIREKEPARPSTRLNTLQRDELTTTAKWRGTEAPRLIHLVRGDLDWIVMKCLEKDRTRRYETANDLAQDIERHLGHEPVTACPPSAAYRAQKFVRRNKGIVTAGAAVAAALVLGSGVSIWQAVRASRQQVRAEANEKKATNAMTLAEEQRRLAQAQAYAADMKVADTALRENNLGQAMTALRRHFPKAGEEDLRGIEWRYLWRKCQGQQSKVFKYESEVTCAELSPDGRWLATESGGAFWAWDTARAGGPRMLSSGASRDTGLGLGEHLAMDPQGRALATATTTNVWIWNIPDWRALKSLPATNASLCFSGDGATLATFGEEGVQVWKTANWEPLVEREEIAKHVTIGGFSDVVVANCRRVALNRDGSRLAVSWQNTHRHEWYPEGEVTLLTLPQCQRLSLFQGGEVRDANRLAFSEDDHWLATGTYGPPAKVWLWSLPEGKLMARRRVSEGLGRGLAFSPDGKVLATAGTDHVIRIWDLGDTNRAPELLRGHLNEVYSLRFAADGRLVSASNDKTVRLWNTKESRTRPSAFNLPQGRLICGQPADARKMLTVNLTNLTFEEWDLDSGQCFREQGIQGADAVLRRGTRQPLQTSLLLSTFVTDPGVQRGVERVRCLWHVPHGAESPARAWDLCASTGDGRLFAWNAESGALVYSNKVAATLVAAIPVTNYRKLVLYEDWGGPLSSYDQQTHQSALIEERVADSPFAVSPDERLLAYATKDGRIRVRDAATEQTKFTLKPPEWSLSTEFQFSQDSRLIAVTTPTGWAQVFDVASGQPVGPPLTGYLAETVKASFSADSKSVVTYCIDATARIWNIATGREMVSGLRVNSFLVNHWYWRLLPPDGNSVVEGGEGEGAIRVLRLPTLAEIDALEKEEIKGP